MSAAIACGWQRINILKKWLLLHEITNNFAQNHFSVFTFCIVQIGSVFEVRTSVTKASKAISRKCNNVKGIHARFVASSIRKTLKNAHRYLDISVDIRLCDRRSTDGKFKLISFKRFFGAHRHSMQNWIIYNMFNQHDDWRLLTFVPSIK